MKFVSVGFVCGAVAATLFAGAATTAALARGAAKEFYVQDYQVAGPAKGIEGQVGSYYCSYQRLPNRVCAIDGQGNERCAIKGWTLRQHCY